MAREGKEKTPKTDREKVKPEEKINKDDKVKAGNGDATELSRERDVIKESKSKEKGDRSAAAATLKSPTPRSDSVESERGERNPSVAYKLSISVDVFKCVLTPSPLPFRS